MSQVTKRNSDQGSAEAVGGYSTAIPPLMICVSCANAPLQTCEHWVWGAESNVKRISRFRLESSFRNRAHTDTFVLIYSEVGHFRIAFYCMHHKTKTRRARKKKSEGLLPSETSSR
jgi:hypothetical protein